MGGTNRQRETSVGCVKLAGRPPDREGCPHVPRASEVRGGFRAIGVAVSRLARPILAKRGGGILVRLKAEWAAVAGPEWAEVAWPNALGRDGALKLRAESGVALDLQHRAPLIIERINQYFGRTVVTRLVLVQGPLPLRAEPGRRPAQTLAAAKETALDDRLSAVADPELRTALARLGRAVASRED
jgi:hypothetical protein